MTKNIITIDLPPHLADYCRHEFGVDNEENIILRRSHDIGKQIYSHILTADLSRITPHPLHHPRHKIQPLHPGIPFPLYITVGRRKNTGLHRSRLQPADTDPVRSRLPEKLLPEANR